MICRQVQCASLRPSSLWLNLKLLASIIQGQAIHSSVTYLDYFPSSSFTQGLAAFEGDRNREPKLCLE
jgi:hypothetical protein